jgi:ceramide glucosyltransferase
MSRSGPNYLRYVANGLLALFVLDRLLKLTAVIHFFRFRRTPPRAPQSWPSVTLLQPITRGVSGLPNNLRSRAVLDYPGEIQYLFICDAHDREAQAVCAALLAEFPMLEAEIVLVEAKEDAVASKIEKLLAALPRAAGEVFWFIDDDIALRPLALRIMIPPLFQPGVGTVFGLACYTNWRTIWSSLMSIFVNANALLSYIPATYLTEPFTITGHCFALRREVFQRAGGFDGLERRVDDDHELARRVRKIGLRSVQTPMIYDVDNHFNSWHAYTKQMKRWFIFPRQTLAPFLTPWEQVVTFLGSIGQLFPCLLALLFICTLKGSAFRALATSLGCFGAIYALCELCYLKRRTPLRRWPLLPIVALLSPVQILWALLSNEEIEWRGQRLRIHVGGEMEVLL